MLTNTKIVSHFPQTAPATFTTTQSVSNLPVNVNTAPINFNTTNN